MFDDATAEKVESKFETLAAEADKVTDADVTPEALAEYVEGVYTEDENPVEDLNMSMDTEDTTEDTTEESSTEDTTGKGINFEEMDYTDLQKMAGNQLETYPEDATKDGLIEALRGNVSLEESSSETTEDTTEEPSSEDMTTDELIEAGVKSSNASTVKKYRNKHGVCKVEGCVYGCNEDDETCASHSSEDITEEPSTDTTEDTPSNADMVEKAKAVFGDKHTTTEIREAVEAKNTGIVETVADAL